MANNRLDLKCDICGETCRIAKYYPSTGWYINVGSEEEALGWAQRFAAFLEKHSPCCFYDQGQEANHGRIFSLQYEVPKEEIALQSKV